VVIQVPDDEYRFRFAIDSVVHSAADGEGLEISFQSAQADGKLRIRDVVDVTSDPSGESAVTGRARAELIADRINDSTVRELLAQEAGHLHLVTSSVTIDVEPNPDYESWEIDGENESYEVRAVTLPGGELQVWERSKVDGPAPAEEIAD
jgi:hypothetical protein